jgi:hypothetical protein
VGQSLPFVVRFCAAGVYIGSFAIGKANCKVDSPPAASLCPAHNTQAMLGFLIVLVIILIAAAMLWEKASPIVCRIPIVGGSLCKCPAGYSTDLTIPGCWECPPGTTRDNTKAINDPKACVVDCGKKYDRGFPDPDGSCWSCPQGFNRTADPVTSGTACNTNCSDINPDWFYDLTVPGCWSCPAGLVRSAYSITSNMACGKPGSISADDKRPAINHGPSKMAATNLGPSAVPAQKKPQVLFGL